MSSQWLKACFDARMLTAAIVTEQGYQVEMAILLRSIILIRKRQHQLGSWVYSSVPPRRNYRPSCIRIDRDNECLSPNACIYGFKRYEKSKSLQLTPTLVANHQESRNLFSNSNWESQTDYEVGLDVKWGISSDIFLNATFNPDFSQVEADDAQININDNFTLTIEEKRPFFLENQDIFNTDYDLVYTRNISSPDVGAKVTGRTGKHAFGLFVTDDESTTFFVPAICHQSRNSTPVVPPCATATIPRIFILIFGHPEPLTTVTTTLQHRLLQTHPTGYFSWSDYYSNTEYPQDLSQQFCNGDSQEDCLSETDCQFDNCDINEAFSERLVRRLRRHVCGCVTITRSAIGSLTPAIRKLAKAFVPI